MENLGEQRNKSSQSSGTKAGTSLMYSFNSCKMSTTQGEKSLRNLQQFSPPKRPFFYSSTNPDILQLYKYIAFGHGRVEMSTTHIVQSWLEEQLGYEESLEGSVPVILIGKYPDQ